MSFDSYFWLDAHFDDPALSAARAELAQPTSEEASKAAFRRLLRSDSVAAQGVAFDQYRYAEASSRFGDGNPFEPEAEEVLQRAREALRQPPTARGEQGARIDGANHASALAAILNLAQSEDAQTVVDVLGQAGNSDVRTGALEVAQSVAERSATVDPALVGAVARAVDNPQWPWRDREQALAVLYEAAPAAAIEKALQLLNAPDLRMRIRAAWVLAEADLERHRPLLTELAASWPDDAPYPAFEVRQALADED